MVTCDARENSVTWVKITKSSMEKGNLNGNIVMILIQVFINQRLQIYPCTFKITVLWIGKRSTGALWKKNSLKFVNDCAANSQRCETHFCVSKTSETRHLLVPCNQDWMNNGDRCNAMFSSYTNILYFMTVGNILCKRRFREYLAGSMTVKIEYHPDTTVRKVSSRHPHDKCARKFKERHTLDQYRRITRTSRFRSVYEMNHWERRSRRKNLKYIHFTGFPVDWTGKDSDIPTSNQSWEGFGKMWEHSSDRSGKDRSNFT